MKTPDEMALPTILSTFLEEEEEEIFEQIFFESYAIPADYWEYDPEEIDKEQTHLTK